MTNLNYYKSLNFIFDALPQTNGIITPAYTSALNQIRDQKVYKFMELKYVVNMITTKKLWVGKVDSWDDVYENIIFKQRFIHDIGNSFINVDVKDVSTRFFGQCWSLLPESDALWRIYAPVQNEYAVRISTTIGKLMDAIFISEQCFPSTFIGQVKYLNGADITAIINDYANQGLHLASDNRQFAELLMLKRKEFEHEKEVRIIISEDTDFTGNHLEFEIDPHTFIEEITLDSRMDINSQKFNDYNQALLNTGYPSSKINRSTLYDLPTPVTIQIM